MVIADFFGKVDLPDGTMERFMNQIVCHVFLITLALVNVVYLVFIEGLGKGALQKSFLQQLALFGALMQIGSCGNSITRYNIQDEYNPLISNLGAGFGLAAGCFNNIAVASILFHGCDNRKMKWGIFSTFLIGLSLFLIYMEVTTFDDTHFFYFRVLNMQSTPFAAFCLLYTSRALNKGTVKIDSAIISKEAAVGVFKVMGYFLVFGFFCNMTGYTIFIYIFGGLTFGCINVSTYYMDKMVGLYDKPVGGEGESLLP